MAEGVERIRTVSYVCDRHHSKHDVVVELTEAELDVLTFTKPLCHVGGLVDGHRWQCPNVAEWAIETWRYW